MGEGRMSSIPQNPHEIRTLVQSLESSKTRGKKPGRGGFSCKKGTYEVAGTTTTVDSWRFADWDYKRDDLPTYARGLFTTKRGNGDPEIVIRGYDKFFNVGEVKETQWRNIESHTVGPYELSVKENGCIIFMSGLEDGTLLVCSKHSTGARQDVNLSHAVAGERWVKRHLEKQGKTTKDLAETLRGMNATAVGELCDDEFEEHVLAYPPELAGLYLHGVNFNLPVFATLPGPAVHRFADQWGFKKADYLVIDRMEQVRPFLDGCAETGSWNGRDTEGFVVRCRLKDKSGNPGRDWFFKYKFDEPYLMYRQWRECTKAVIAGKAPKYKKHQKITEEYLLYVRRKFAERPALTQLYQQNHGIIEIRDEFLAEKGKKGSDIIAEEEAQSGVDGTSRAKVVLVPIATIGCGKTTVATALVQLFGFGHVQNDNIQGKGQRGPRFALAVTNLLADHHMVIADRNNHQKREREQIIEDVTKVVPHAQMVALHYVHEPKDKMIPAIRRVTRDRVLDRGDNHQTIHADSKGEAEVIHIMDGFLNRFQGCDTRHAPDSHFDHVIDLDPCASSLENLETVVTRLYNAYPDMFRGEMPSGQDMEEAIDFAMSQTVDKDQMHDLSSNVRNKASGPKETNSRGKQGGAAPKQVSPEETVKRLEYFGIGLSAPNINSVLSSLFSNASADEAGFYKRLKKEDRLQKEFHVTLMHRASSGALPQLWQSYTERCTQAMEHAGTQDTRTPSLGAARLRLERVIWDDRVMAVLVRILPPTDGSTWECANAYPHITIGTAGNDIKPRESNDLIKNWMEAGDQNSHIHSKDIPGMKELEGAVRPVLQRGK